MANTYILYSASLGRYYIGATKLKVEERLAYHLTHHNGYTSRAEDWEIVYISGHKSYKGALAEERQIKGRGARRYLESKGK